MTDCWSKNPHQRPCFDDIVKTLFDLLDSDTAYIPETLKMTMFYSSPSPRVSSFNYCGSLEPLENDT